MDTTTSPHITCPLCRADNVRIVSTTDKLLVCACNKCAAQFTITRPDKSSV